MDIQSFYQHEIVSLAVKSIGKPCLYVENHLEYLTEQERDIWDYVVLQIFEFFKEDNQYCGTLVGNLMGNCLVSFESLDKLEEFSDFFFKEPVYSSGIYAVIYDEDGTHPSNRKHVTD